MKKDGRIVGSHDVMNKTLCLLSSSAGPIPDNMSSLGVSIAPPVIIISFVALTALFTPSWVKHRFTSTVVEVD